MALSICFLFCAAFPVLAADSALSATPYPFDNAHCVLDFTVDVTLAGRVRGAFRHYDGVIMYDPDDLTRSAVDLLIDASSIDTGLEMRDDHLKQEDFFNVEEHPQIRFRSETVQKGAGGYRLVGPLTIKGVTREIEVPFQVLSAGATDPFGNRRIIFAGSLQINRHDFGVTGPDFWNQAISDDVTVDFTIGARIYEYSRVSFRNDDRPSLGQQIMDAYQAGGMEEVRRLVSRAYSEQPGDVNLSVREVYVAGMRLFQGGHEADATDLFELTLNEHPDLSEANRSSLHSQLGLFFAQAGDAATARRHLEKALDLDPENLEATEMLRYLSRSSKDARSLD